MTPRAMLANWPEVVQRADELFVRPARIAGKGGRNLPVTFREERTFVREIPRRDSVRSKSVLNRFAKDCFLSFALAVSWKRGHKGPTIEAARSYHASRLPIRLLASPHERADWTEGGGSQKTEWQQHLENRANEK